MSNSNKILYISQEIVPYSKPSAMGEACNKIPGKVQERGYEVRAFMPKYGCINERRNQLHEVIRLSGINISVDDTDHPLIIKVATLQSSKMQVYFIDNDDYFQHHAANDLEIRETPEDNDERLIFFVRGVMETVKKLRWVPEVIHCSGWLSSLAPMYIRKQYADDPTLSSAKVVYSLFRDDDLDQKLNGRFVEKLLQDRLDITDMPDITDSPEPANLLRLHKTAIRHADAIIVAEEGVSEELIAFAESLGKPLFRFNHEENDPEALVEFYRSLN